MIQNHIEVSLGERTYSIHVGSDSLSSLAPTCEENDIPKRVVVITDATVAHFYLRPLLRHLVQYHFEPLSIVIPPGERQKNLSRANAIFTKMLKNGVGRKSAVLALGGGVIGDLAGFVAAIYHRGVKLVQVPTTLLSQVDSSVGGKVAVNHPLGKNIVGAFYQPSFVWVDVGVLKTLPPREIVCGLGEIVKYGVIRDADLYSYIESHLDNILRLDQEAVLHVQSTCCGIKAQLVSQDERETGIRVILNYGHTVGHALEAAGRYSVLKHGEAVLIGMVAESFIAKEIGMESAETHQKIVELIGRIPLKAKFRSLKMPEILKAMGHDKKTVEGKKRFVLPVRIGEVKVVESIEPQLIRASLKYTFGLLGQRRAK